MSSNVSGREPSFDDSAIIKEENQNLMHILIFLREKWRYLVVEAQKLL